jgi:hypothetical protein
MQQQQQQQPQSPTWNTSSIPHGFPGTTYIYLYFSVSIKSNIYCLDHVARYLQ